MKVIPLYPRNMDEKLDRIARRLMILLRTSDDPEREMSNALGYLEEHGLWNGSMDPAHVDLGRPRFFGFARNLINENLLLREVLEMCEREFEPIYCETVEELLTELVQR